VSSALVLSNLCVEIPGCSLISGIQLSVAAGERLAILGPNGAGKTTLLRAVAGLRRAYSGSIVLNGREVRELSCDEISRSVALVPQRLDNLPRFTVRDFIELSGTARREYVNRLVGHLHQRHLPDLSGGELQRVLLAGALAQGAQVLLLDEPTSNLDPTGRSDVVALLDELRNEKDLAIIMVTHDVSLALRCTSRLVVMHRGELCWVVDCFDPSLVEQLERSYNCRFVRVEGEDGKSPFIIAR
jgi:iron complex transport system ATP-binding protein